MRRMPVLFFLLFSFINLNAADSTMSQLDAQIKIQSQKFETLMKIAALNFVDSVDVQKVSDAAFEAMLKAIDRQSRYYSEEKYRKIRESNKGRKVGIGVDVIPIRDTNVVIKLETGSPAYEMGIEIGDKILMIDGVSAIGLSKAELTAKLKGKDSSEVVLIIRKGYSGELKETKMLRRSVALPSISLALLIPGTKIAYFKANRFSSISDDEFYAFADSLKKLGMEKVIFDLRHNPGGYVAEASNIISEFLPKGKQITYTKAKNPIYSQKFEAATEGLYKEMPIILLVNEKSASASEIFAGVIQDYDRGLVVGTPTFGKGTSQKYWNFKDSSGFRITVAKYYIPSGRYIQKKSTSTNSNIAAAENMFDESGKLLMYHSEKGRTLFGGGGIVPDRFISNDTTTKLTQYLRSKGIFLDYGLQYMYANHDAIVETYPNYMDFIEGFKVNDELAKDLERHSRKMNIWNAEMYKTDEELIKTYIKAYIAHAFWGDEAYAAVLIEVDDYIQEAIKLFPQINDIINDQIKAQTNE
jgi:carboxyl-terminal processing protease